MRLRGLSHAMIKREFERFSSSITMRSVTDGLRFVVQGLHCAIVD